MHGRITKRATTKRQTKNQIHELAFDDTQFKVFLATAKRYDERRNCSEIGLVKNDVSTPTMSCYQISNTNEKQLQNL